jgi:polar amino acid transport system substrate-binding protein
MRKALVLLPVVAALAALAITTTASGREEKASAIPGCAKASLNLVEDGKLTIGTDNPAFPPWWGGKPKKPWEVSDPASGQGYESAVAYGIARRLGFGKGAVDWIAVPFNKSFAPGKKDFDFYMAQVSYRPERAKQVSFSGPYYFVNQAVVGLKGKPITRVRSLAGLRQYKLGAQIGTTSYQYIVNYIKPSQTPAVYDSNADAVAALKNGQLDGLVIDFPSTGYITGVQVPNSKVVGRLPTRGPKEYFGAVFQKGNPLVRCVNRALSRMRADGSLRRLEIRWLAQSGGAPILR